MKDLEEYIIDSKLENYLIDSLLFYIDCRKYTQPQFFGIFEHNGVFINYDKTLAKVSNFLIKHVDETDIQSNEYIIDVSDCEVFFDKVKIILNKTNDNNTGGLLKVSDKQITIHLELNYKFKIDINDVDSIILHELVHGYEEYNRITNNKKSIFDEISNEYYNSQYWLGSRVDSVRNIAVLKYFLNAKERNANFGTLEKEVKHLIEKINPGRTRNDYGIIRNELKKSDIWSRYFEFGKFVANIDNYSDKELESAYYNVVVNIEKQYDDIRKSIENIKSGTKENLKYVKPASKIRKEIKTIWNKFINKFNILFAKIYCEHYINKHEFRGLK